MHVHGHSVKGEVLVMVEAVGNYLKVSWWAAADGNLAGVYLCSCLAISAAEFDTDPLQQPADTEMIAAAAAASGTQTDCGEWLIPEFAAESAEFVVELFAAVAAATAEFAASVALQQQLVAANCSVAVDAAGCSPAKAF